MFQFETRGLRKSSIVLLLVPILLLSYIVALFICLWFSYTLMQDLNEFGLLYLSASLGFGYYGHKTIFPSESSGVVYPSLLSVSGVSPNNPSKKDTLKRATS
jgi:hypothetical protein